MSTPKTMPAQKPHRSKQDYQTPREFLDAVQARFGRIVFDLSCTTANCVARAGWYFDRGYDGLAESWDTLAQPGEVAWLNPEFGNVAPWAEKCAGYAGAGLVTMLIPAAVSTEYYADHIHDRAFVAPIRPRLIFVGEEDPYPKDLMLCVYGMGLRGFQPWRWKP